jgi:hypothetical protein
MADLAHQHITDGHPGTTRRDFGRRGRLCRRHGSIFDRRRHRIEGATLAFGAPPARLAAGAIIEIG